MRALISHGEKHRRHLEFGSCRPPRYRHDGADCILS